MNEGGYRESHLTKGADYHEIFTSRPHTAVVWSLERRLLRRIVRKRFPDRSPSHLDFACGTGRFLELLSPITASSTGVDISASMLEVARDRLTGVELVEADITRADCLGSRRFDLITAFRFFPNAEPPLRRDALDVLVKHLEPNGALVFNNHLNRDSLVQRIVVSLGRTGATLGRNAKRGMSRREAYDLVEESGLAVEREYHLAVLPFTDRHMLRPATLLEGLEEGLGRIGWLAPVAQNLIYVCRRATSESRQSSMPVATDTPKHENGGGVAGIRMRAGTPALPVWVPAFAGMTGGRREDGW